jgi:hypothetical protein
MIKQAILLTYSLLLGLSSCSTFNSNECVIYFGGQITNPKSDFITLKKGDKILDTLFLNDENKFLGEFKKLDDGLYSFTHGNELQYVFFENRDSIIVNINTLDFDESLAFSGKGSEKNEYLINFFLENEKENRNFRDNYELPAQVFQKLIFDLKLKKEITFTEFENNQKDISDKFKELALSSIKYSLYKKMEYYPLANKKITKSTNYPKLTEDFYSFRKETNINNKELVGYYLYTDYIINYLYNQSFCKMNPDKDSKCSVSLCFFKSVDKNITIESFKNKLLMGNILHTIIKESSTEDIDVLQLFLEISSDTNDKAKIEKLISDKTFLVDNDTLKNFKITSANGKTSNLYDISKNNDAVIYFWSNKYMDGKYLKKRVNYLTKKHPNIKFIGINTDQTEIASDTDFLKLENYNLYKLAENSFGKNYNTSGYPRTIILSKDKIVVNSYTNISSKYFSDNLSPLKKTIVSLD